MLDGDTVSSLAPVLQYILNETNWLCHPLPLFVAVSIVPTLNMRYSSSYRLRHLCPTQIGRLLEPSRTPLEYVTLNSIFDTNVDAIRRAIPKVRRIRIIYALLQNEQSFKSQTTRRSTDMRSFVSSFVRFFDRAIVE